MALKKLTDPSLAIAMMPLATSENPYQRNAGLYALRHTKNPAAMPVFYQALSDPEPINQFDAIMAMAEIAGVTSPDAVTALDLFLQDPRPYLDWWERWWQEEGKARYGSLTLP